MSWFDKVLSAPFQGLIEGVANTIDRFTLDKEEKAQLQMELEKLAQAAESELEQTMRSELQAKERIMVAELQQGDNYTKRARPTVVYGGLAMIFYNYSLVPLVGWGVEVFSDVYVKALPALPLPAEFWYAWGGIVATWSVGRTMERRGSANNLVALVTGNETRTNRPSLLD